MSEPTSVALARVDDTAVDGLLAELRRCGHLATVTPAGSPQVGPVWFWWDRPRLWVVTRRRTLRVRNIKNNPRISMSVDVDRFPARGAVLAGRATLLDPEPEVIRRIVQRYIPATRVEEFVARYIADPDRLLICVDVARATGWDASQPKEVVS